MLASTGLRGEGLATTLLLGPGQDHVSAVAGELGRLFRQLLLRMPELWEADAIRWRNPG